ncbi:hypothetical protein BJX99DRAFT_207665 [Aspergillus californicus]
MGSSDARWIYRYGCSCSTGRLTTYRLGTIMYFAHAGITYYLFSKVIMLGLTSRDLDLDLDIDMLMHQLLQPRHAMPRQ